MVDSKKKLAEMAIENARSALENGDKTDAKKWVEQASQLAPELEDPWLVLAYLAEPLEGLKYLEKALTLNPASQRARKGIQYIIRKMQDQNCPIPSGVEKYTELESKPSQPAKMTPTSDQIQKIENPVPIKEPSHNNIIKEESQKDAALEKLIDTINVAAEVILDEKKVEILDENQSTQHTEIKTNSMNEPGSPSEHPTLSNAPLTFSLKQPSNLHTVDFGSIFITLFGLLILSITILVILYTNHLIPFLK